jgi:hypothetical protein
MAFRGSRLSLFTAEVDKGRLAECDYGLHLAHLGTGPGHQVQHRAIAAMLDLAIGTRQYEEPLLFVVLDRERRG